MLLTIGAYRYFWRHQDGEGLSQSPQARWRGAHSFAVHSKSSRRCMTQIRIWVLSRLSFGCGLSENLYLALRSTSLPPILQQRPRPNIACCRLPACPDRWVSHLYRPDHRLCNHHHDRTDSFYRLASSLFRHFGLHTSSMPDSAEIGILHHPLASFDIQVTVYLLQTGQGTHPSALELTGHFVQVSIDRLWASISSADA